MTTTRTLQVHNPTGCCYVLEYDALNIISGLSYDLDYRVYEALTADDLWDVDVYDEDALWANDENWQPPVLISEREA